MQDQGFRNMDEKRTLLLDAHQTSITEKGIPYFYWPMSPHHASSLYKKLIRKMTLEIRKAADEAIVGVDAAIILSHDFICEVVQVYDAENLVNQASRDDCDVVPTDKDRLVKAIVSQQTPHISQVLQELHQGVSRYQPAEDILQTKSGMRRRKYLPMNYAKHIISATLSPLASLYAKKSKQKVFYRPLATWLHAPKRKKAFYYTKNDQMITLMMQVVLENGLEQIQLSPLMKDYLVKWLQDAFSWVDYYWEQLASQQHKIPKRLWLEEGRDIWGRILARYVRQQGGQVTRFDPEFNYGYFENSFELNLVDFEDCDTYICLSEKQVEALRNSFVSDWVVQKNPPQWISVEVKQPFLKPLKMIPRTIDQRRARPTILYLSTIRSIEPARRLVKGLMNDVLFLDFEARLTQKLRSWNFNVMLRSHRSDKKAVNVPVAIQYVFGAIATQVSIEKACEQADIVLFDDASAALLSRLILSEKPCVFLDFQSAKFNQEAKQVLTKRCPVISAGYDEGHRMQVDWFALRNAILNAHQCTDRFFSVHYLNG